MMLGDKLDNVRRTIYPGSKTAFLIRSYAGHGEHPFYNIRNCLISLINQHNPNWEAFVFKTDTKPFPKLRQIVDDLDDNRIHFVEVCAIRYYWRRLLYKTQQPHYGQRRKNRSQIF